MDTKFLADKAEFHFNSNVPLYILLTGIVILVVGLLVFKKFDNNLKLVLPIMGGMAIAIGAIFWLSRQHLVLIIDKQKQHILLQEKTSEGILNSTLPFDNFRALVVQRAVSTSKSNNSSGTSRSISFQIQLLRNDGAMVKLATHRQFKNAYSFVEKIKKLLPYKTYIINTPTEEYQAYITKFKQLEDVEILSDFEPLLTTRFDDKQTPAKIQLPKNTSFSQKKNSAGTTYTWGNRKNVWTMLLALVFFTGFVFFAQLINQSTVKLVINIFVGIIGLALLYGLVNSMFGKSSLQFGSQQLTYQNVLFGMKTVNQSWNYNDIAGILSELDDSGDRPVNLSSKMGQDLMHRMAYQTPESLASDILGLVMNYKSYFMTIDMNGLRLSERLYIEQEIGKRKASAVQTQ